MSDPETCGTVSAVALGLPSTTAVPHPRGRLPKEGFYRNTAVPVRLRRRFIDDIDQIVMLAVIRPQEIRIPAGERTKEIDVIGLLQTGENPPVEVMEHIARMRDEQTGHAARILFACVRDREYRLAVYRNANMRAGITEGKIHVSEPRGVIGGGKGLVLDGGDLDEMWDCLCAQVILNSENGMDLDRRVADRTRIMRLNEDIAKLEKQHAKAKQIGQRNRLWNELQDKRKELKTINQGAIQ